MKKTRRTRRTREDLSDAHYRFILGMLTSTLVSCLDGDDDDPVGALAAYREAVTLARNFPEAEDEVFAAENCGMEAEIVEKLIRRLGISS